MRRGVRVGVVLTILAAAAGPAQASGSTGVEKPLWQQSQDYWTTLAAPRVAPSSPDRRVGRAAEPDWFTEAVQQHHTGFPPAAQELARREAVASRAGTAKYARGRRRTPFRLYAPITPHLPRHLDEEVV